jgi:hypothetical protein
MRHALFVLALLLVSCTNREPVQEATPRRSVIETTALAMVAPPSDVPVSDVEQEPKPQEPVPDPYADHDSWCEDIFKKPCECPGKDPIVCEEPKEPCPDDRTGKSQICVHTKWSRREGSYVYMCDPGWLNRRQQKRQRQAQKLIVEELCQTPAWADALGRWGKEHRYGDDPSKLCWHLPGGSKELKACRGGHYCQADKLAKFLALVAARESTWNNNIAHELERDVKANKGSYRKAKHRGWYTDNQHFFDRDRWARGYGWYGQNAALNVFRWDPKAPPEILCREVESTEVYLRNARGSFKKLWNIYGDDAERTYKLDTGEEVKVKGVTWYDVHRAIASGKLYPEETITTKKWIKKKQKWRKVGFVSRARSKNIDLDPFETVMWEMLGEAIPRDRQNEIAEEIRQNVRNYFEPQAQTGGSMEPATVGG